MRIKELRS